MLIDIEPQFFVWGRGAVLENGVEVGKVRIQSENMTPEQVSEMERIADATNDDHKAPA